MELNNLIKELQTIKSVKGRHKEVAILLISKETEEAVALEIDGINISTVKKGEEEDEIIFLQALIGESKDGTS